MTRPSENVSQLCGQREDHGGKITLDGGTFKDRSAGHQHLSRIWEHIQEATWVDDFINPFTQHGVRHDHTDAIELNEQLYEEIRKGLRREVDPPAEQVKKLRNPRKVDDSRDPTQTPSRRSDRTHFHAKFDGPLQPNFVDYKPPPRCSRYNRPELIVQKQS
ncbi:hypothetical protein LTR96_011620 [Exophiala xenobiotica]|nr:hypothetical protein LTR96_011620 [Exophiala xenobiotica]KAK5332266.1 hypothetical protein LTR98_011598 [Exophiala xenobiotica]